jgi:hypothetical protein
MFHGLLAAFQNGGWAMWPISLFGLIGMGVAANFAWRGDCLLLGLVRWLTVALIALGGFGFFVDLQAVMHYSSAGLASLHAGTGGVPSELRAHIVLEGIGESLNCLSSAFLFSAMIALLVAIGRWRSPTPAQAV